MTQEEKAKAYDKAIERAKEYEIRKNCLVRPHLIFPELKESEDDKIRKDLIAFLEDIWHFGKNANFDKWDKSDCSDWIAWLEKKREKKPEWSEDDENEFNHIIHILNLAEEEQEIKGYNNLIGTVDWFKSLKNRIQSNQSNKPQDKSALEAINEKQDKKADVIENFDTEFEKQVSHLLASVINKDYEYTEGFVKWVSSNLLGYAKYEIEKQGK
jgi:hypothetical protein